MTKIWVLITNNFKTVFIDQQWKFPLALIGCLSCPIDSNAFCIQLVSWADEDLQIHALHFVPKLVMFVPCNINTTMWLPLHYLV